MMSLNVFVGTGTYDCEHADLYSFAFKETDDAIYSAGVGAAIAVGIFVATSPWWRKFVLYSAPSDEMISKAESLDISLSEQEGPDAPRVEEKYSTGVESDYDVDGDADRWTRAHNTSSSFRKAEHESPERVSNFQAALLYIGLVSFISVAAVVPNAAYVAITESQLVESRWRGLLVTALALTKIGLVSSAVPFVSRRVVQLATPDFMLAKKSNLRLKIDVCLHVFVNLIVPVATVLVQDKRCLYFYFYPKEPLHTDISVRVCAVTDVISGDCLEETTDTVTSLYTPTYDYRNQMCVSSVFITYGPVYLAVPLLAGLVPAFVDLVLAPCVVPYLRKHSEGNFVARQALRLLLVTSLTSPIGMPFVSHDTFDNDIAAHRVLERAFSSLLSNLVIAATWGLGVPFVGMTCCLSAGIQLSHYSHMFNLIISRCNIGGTSPYYQISACNYIMPVSVGLVVFVIMTCAWTVGSANYLNATWEGTSVAIVSSCLLALILLARYAHRIKWHNGHARRAARRAEDENILIAPLFFDGVSEQS